MSYTTYQHLTDRFGASEIIQLTDREQTGSIDYDVLDQAIADADAEINSYLTAYPLPLAVVPANLVRIACDIARYYLYDVQLIEPVQARYDQAIAYLRMVASGKVSLGADASGATPAEASSSPLLSSTEPGFVSNF